MFSRTDEYTELTDENLAQAFMANKRKGSKMWIFNSLTLMTMWLLWQFFNLIYKELAQNCVIGSVLLCFQGT